MDQALVKVLQDFAGSSKHISVLTGAGISAESGIPTFRGPEGYWTVGSEKYQPQEMATHKMFTKQPHEVWKWYLCRMEVCRKAEPNAGHYAIAEMEKLFGDRFGLITQNVDNLHLRAGNSPERTFQIHGNVFHMRCCAADIRECDETIYPVPEALQGWSEDRELTADDKKLLTCPKCGGPTRPHVLWFDEVYNEPFYRMTSTLALARKTDLLIVVGTSGMTNMPNKVAFEVSRNHRAVIVDVNIEKNPFAALAERSGGFTITEPGGTALPAILTLFKG
ncbi:iron dicitrate transport regulator FecR [Desulfonema ishimotonii]|uniref:protein acetyllysine N-acetyltransferase n=1 Tax=Desulfonema ishimotonii TaxID=45657 RepID=A0A401FYK0_9BACT|nr:Sir2 family NAD-dependent protein deacetylase [Desulfonema ishimotonii]GBC62037.1 iron dicitrate transport regulator FecR [Desulfonema ishimotonii]